MIPDVIYTYEDFQHFQALISGLTSLFWIVEYSPNELGYGQDDSYYKALPTRYSLMRNECLNHPQDFQDRLNNKKYRIWTTIPREIPW